MYLRAFVEKMGPVGFGLGVTSGLLAMLAMLLGAVGNGWGVAAGLALGAVAGAFAFFLVGTATLAGLRVLRLVWRMLQRGG